MKTGQYKRGGHPVTPVLAVTIGLGVCVLASLLFAIVTALLISGERLPQSAITAASLPVQLFAVFAGCITAIILYGKMPAIIATICAGSYFALLVCTNILILDSSLNGAGKGFAAALFGAVLAVLIDLLRKKNKKHKKVRIR